ncbi:MAG TPA: hypothetical protein VMM84_01790 [Pyrinomonadaceae bacterium]|nr:hypothetical protein [Pyrinomonadaceae bacterium]
MDTRKSLPYRLPRLFRHGNVRQSHYAKDGSPASQAAAAACGILIAMAA